MISLSSHLRAHVAAYLATSFALGATSWAIGNGPPFVSGGGEITSSATPEVPATPVDLQTTGLNRDEQGPAFLAIEGFGEFYLAGCFLVLGVGPEYVRALAGYRNTTDHPVDLESIGRVASGENVSLDGYNNTNSQLLAYESTNGKKGEVVTHIATAHWTIQQDSDRRTCRTYSQVIEQP
jgi:hypothetical protein